MPQLLRYLTDIVHVGPWMTECECDPEQTKLRQVRAVTYVGYDPDGTQYFRVALEVRQSQLYFDNECHDTVESATHQGELECYAFFDENAPY